MWGGEPAYATIQPDAHGVATLELGGYYYVATGSKNQPWVTVKVPHDLSAYGSDVANKS